MDVDIPWGAMRLEANGIVPTLRLSSVGRRLSLAVAFRARIHKGRTIAKGCFMRRASMFARRAGSFEGESLN